MLFQEEAVRDTPRGMNEVTDMKGQVKIYTVVYGVRDTGE